MAKPKVYIFLPVDQSGESHDRIIEAGCELYVEENMRHYIAESNEDYVLKPDVETSALVGVGARPIPITKEVMERLPDLRLIAMYTVGFDNVDMDAASKMGILVTHCPTEANWGGVAEGTVAYMLAILKKVREKDRHVKQGGWREMSLKCSYVGRRADGW
jgi:lactate dehydrogenase-like 2-hydroxyacid dehydrogenase